MTSIEMEAAGPVMGCDTASVGAPLDLSPAHLEVRRRFLGDPAATDLSGVRPLVARSWRRSVAANARFDGVAVRCQPEIDPRVVDSAEAAVRTLLRATGGRGGCVVIADRYGTVATVRGARSALRWAEHAFAPGVSLAEESVGTNCIGTAIEEERGATIAGAEHLAPHLAGCWSASALVRDPLRRSVRAILALVLPLEALGDLSPEGLAAAVDGAAAEAMNVLGARLAAREQALLTAYLRQVRKRGPRAVMAIDGRTTIANHGAIELLGSSHQPVLAAYAQHAQHIGRAIERELSLADGSAVTVHVEPVISAGEPVGSVLHLRAANGTATTSRSSPSSKRHDAFAPLVGQSAAFARALQLAHRAVDRGLCAHVVGEAGTGKRALALAMGRACGPDMLVLDGGRATDRDVVAQAAEVLDRGGAVVLLRVDLLPDATCAQLAALAKTRGAGRMILTARRLSAEGLELAQALGSMEIELPALEARRDDVPALVATFLADAPGPSRVSPRLLETLAEADLPGNVAQLRDIVTTAAQRCTTTELITDDLTAEHRQAIAPTRLSPLQTAEAAQIREALRQANGNRVRAAQILRIGRSTLYRRMETYTRLGLQM